MIHRERRMCLSRAACALPISVESGAQVVDPLTKAELGLGEEGELCVSGPQALAGGRYEVIDVGAMCGPMRGMK